MSERLTDEQVDALTHWQAGRPKPKGVAFARAAAREVQEWRALIPEVIEQLVVLETLDVWDLTADDRIHRIIAKLREAIR